MKRPLSKLSARRTIAAAVGGIALVCLATPGVASAQDRFSRPVLVGVGDSFTSGEGNQPFVIGTNTASDQCHRSDAAYPIVAAHMLGETGRNVACSGASTPDLFTTFNTENAQAGRIQGASDVVVTIGGNDIGALQAVSNPPTPAQFAASLETLAPKLVQTYQALQKADPQGHIYAVAYPSIFGTAANPACPVSQAQRQFLVTATQALDNTISQAANAAHVEYVNTFSAFAGHELCTTDSWVNGQNTQNPSFSLHPNAAGQAALAKAVAQQIGNTKDCKHHGFFGRLF